MDEITIIERAAIALAIGSVVGLERGWSERNIPEGGRVAGLRTFALIGLAGGIDAIVGLELGTFVAAVMALALVGLLVAARFSPIQSPDIGITTEVAAITTFLLGLLVGLGHAVPAAGGAVAVAFLLGLKPVLHRWLQALAQREVFAALQFFLISAVVLPLLPDAPMGPFGAINPYRLWWMVVLISAASLAGYAAMRLMGSRAGILATGLCGGLISSTATTLALARRTRTVVGLDDAATAAILATCTMMVARIAAIAFAVWQPLALRLAAPLGAMGLIGILGTVWFWRRGTNDGTLQAPVSAGNPLDLRTAIVFGLLLGTVMILARMVESTFGTFGLYALSGVSAVVDVDAITLSIAEHAQLGLPIEAAATGIVIAAVVNTLTKASLTAIIASRLIGRRVTIVLTVMAIAAGASGFAIL